MTLYFVATDLVWAKRKNGVFMWKVENGCFFNHLKGYAQHLFDANAMIVSHRHKHTLSFSISLSFFLSLSILSTNTKHTQTHPYSQMLILPIAPTAKHIAFACNIPSFYQQLSVVLHLMLVNAFEKEMPSHRDCWHFFMSL